MNILPQSAKRLIRPSVNATETLVEYIKTIELDPLPDTRQASILEILNSVYDQVPDKEEKPVVKIVDESDRTECVEIQSSDHAGATERSKTTAGFALALTATRTSVIGWLPLLFFHDGLVISFVVFTEFLAICLALVSFTCRNEQTGTRSLGYLSLMITVGWLPIHLFLSDVGELFVDFLPLLFIAFFVAVSIFIAVLCKEDDTQYELKLNR